MTTSLQTQDPGRGWDYSLDPTTVEVCAIHPTPYITGAFQTAVAEVDMTRNYMHAALVNM